jgi:hypothetical protein
VMATNGGEQPLPLMMLWSMKGIFHLLVLVAAGEMLCPFSRKKLDTETVSCEVASCEVASFAGTVG